MSRGRKDRFNKSWSTYTDYKVDPGTFASKIKYDNNLIDKVLEKPSNYVPYLNGYQTVTSSLKIDGEEAGYMDVTVSKAPKAQKVQGKYVDNEYDTNIQITTWAKKGDKPNERYMVEQREFNVDGKDVSKFNVIGKDYFSDGKEEKWVTNKNTSVRSAINSMKSNLVDAAKEEIKKKKK